MEADMNTNKSALAAPEVSESCVADAVTAALMKFRHKITDDQVVIHRASHDDDNALSQFVHTLAIAIKALLPEAPGMSCASELPTLAHELFVRGDSPDRATVDSALANAAATANARYVEMGRKGGIEAYSTRYLVQVHPRVGIYLDALSNEFGASMGALSSELLNRVTYSMHPTILPQSLTAGSAEDGCFQQDLGTQAA
jgi:hypothetical protein